MSLLVSVGLARLTEAISAENVAAIAKLHSGPGGRQYRIEPQIGRPDVYAAEIPDEHRDHEPEVAKEPLLLPVSRESGQTHRQFAGGGGGSEWERREQQLQQARASAAEWGQLQQRIKQEEDSKMASPLARAWQSPGRQPADAASPQPMRQLQHNQQSPACDESKMLSPVQDRKNTPSPASTPPPSPLSPSPLSASPLSASPLSPSPLLPSPSSSLPSSLRPDDVVLIKVVLKPCEIRHAGGEEVTLNLKSVTSVRWM